MPERYDALFGDDGETCTITGGPLKPGEWVLIKSEISAADEAWITNHSAKVGGTKKKPVVNLTIGDIKLATLKRMIISWKLSKTIKSPIDGSTKEKEIFLSANAIDNLPRRISSFLNSVIDDLNPEEEEEDFLGDANDQSEEN